MVTQWRNTGIIRFLRTSRVGACIMTSLLTSSPRRQPQRGARNSNNIEVMVAAKRSIFSTAGLSQLLGSSRKRNAGVRGGRAAAGRSEGLFLADEKRFSLVRSAMVQTSIVLNMAGKARQLHQSDTSYVTGTWDCVATLSHFAAFARGASKRSRPILIVASQSSFHDANERRWDESEYRIFNNIPCWPTRAQQCLLAVLHPRSL